MLASYTSMYVHVYVKSMVIYVHTPHINDAPQNTKTHLLHLKVKEQVI